MLKHITSWRASVASETVLGVDNAQSGICSMYIIYIYIYIYYILYIYIYIYIMYIYIILIARVRVQYGKIFYEHAKYFHEPKASENVA